jgi:acyl-homoserine-lactone acylase
MGQGRSRRRPLAALAAAGVTGALAIALLGAGSRAGAATAPTLTASDAGGPLEATIKRDSRGIPNIIGQNFADVGFGYGYSIAQDNICELAETYVTVRGERSLYSGEGVQGSFGPDGSYLQRGNGFSANNLDSDFFYQRPTRRPPAERPCRSTRTRSPAACRASSSCRSAPTPSPSARRRRPTARA